MAKVFNVGFNPKWDSNKPMTFYHGENGPWRCLEIVQERAEKEAKRIEKKLENKQKLSYYGDHGRGGGCTYECSGEWDQGLDLWASILRARSDEKLGRPGHS